jgi:hypothetical protein
MRSLKAWRDITLVSDHKPRRDCSISEDPGEAMDPVCLLTERYVAVAVAILPERPNPARRRQRSGHFNKASGEDIPFGVGGGDFISDCCCSSSASRGRPACTHSLRAARPSAALPFIRQSKPQKR